MNTTIKNTTTTLQNTAEMLLGTTRDVWYAGLGVFAMLEEEARDAFDALVREGKQVEKGRPNTLTAKAVVEVEDDAREAKRDVKEAGRKVEAFGKDFEARVVETVGTVLNRMNVPTRDDIDSLKKSVDRLNKKAVELRAA
ncbi:MAG: phasin family protein [Rhodothermales bacterium]